MDMDAYYFAMIVGEVFTKLLWFCGGWLVFYVFVGSWLEVRLLRCPDEPRLLVRRHYLTHFIVLLLFSVLFVNPFIFLKAAFGIQVDFGVILTILLFAAYFVLLPTLFTLLVFRVLPRWKRLRWMRWNPPIVKSIVTHVGICIASFGVGVLAYWGHPHIPILLSSLSPRPDAYQWQVDTGSRPLVDHSVTGSAESIRENGSNIFLQVSARDHEWKVVHLETHSLVPDKGPLAYVSGENVMWMVSESPGGVHISQFDGGVAHNVSVSISHDVFFHNREVSGLLIGANASSGDLFAIDPRSGKLEWELKAPVAGTSDRRIGYLSSAGGIVVAGLWSSRLWAVDANTGTEVWQFREDHMGNAMYVVASGDCALGFSRSDAVYCIDLATGHVNWEKRLADVYGTDKVVMAGKRFFFKTTDEVFCARIDNGELVWRTAFGDHYGGGLSFSDGNFIACASGRSLALFNPEDGTELFRTQFPARGARKYGVSGVDRVPATVHARPVIGNDNRIYVFMSDGRLWCVAPELPSLNSSL